MVTGQDILKLAGSRVGEQYIFGANADTSDPDWHGPWDCAEFVTWVIYQLTKTLYGCIDNDADPSNCDAYTGAWWRDARTGVVQNIPVKDAVLTPGGILLRVKTSQYSGHIIFSDGKGGTIEAMSTARGVCKGRLDGRHWNCGILIPGIQY